MLLQLAEHCENGIHSCGEGGSGGVGTGSNGEPTDNEHDKGVTGEREEGECPENFQRCVAHHSLSVLSCFVRSLKFLFDILHFSLPLLVLRSI